MNFTLRNLEQTPVTAEELTNDFGVPASTASELAASLQDCLQQYANSDDPYRQQWQAISRLLASSAVGFDVHRWLFECVHATRDAALGPAPVWYPEQEEVQQSNVMQFAQQLGHDSYTALQEWSANHPAEFWAAVIEQLQIAFSVPPSCILLDGEWLPDAELNIADSCFLAPHDKVAIVTHREDGSRQQTTYGELEELVNRVANGLLEAGFRSGDRLGLMVPMNTESVAAYLGMIKAGCVPVSIAESFAPKEIDVRLKLADAKGIFVSDQIHRAGKTLPCFEKFLQTQSAATAIVIPSGNSSDELQDFGEHKRWQDFLSDDASFKSVKLRPTAESNILFSSGTTGEPKAIPWTHLTPIKCAMDGRFHQNIHEQSIAAWPTSFGWMMGPWIVYASLMNRGTLALFDGAANTREFCEFVQDARVTMLGTIPSLVRVWRSRNLLQGLDWSQIEAFSSTGECSNAEDMHFLMAHAGYRPVVEYCGGTELGGGYIASTVVHPNVPGCFSTPALGVNMLLLAEGSTQSASQGEVFIAGPSIGFSERLLNADHDEVYFASTPDLPNLPRLRRHGDELVHYSNGYYQACGRTDDAMNLGGIKVSAIELERCLNLIDIVGESAAIAIPCPNGGPSRLVICVVLAVGSSKPEEAQLRSEMQSHLSQELNPLFRIFQVVIVDSLPRTPSNKVMRRVLRSIAAKEVS